MELFLQRIFKGDRAIWLVMVALCIVSVIEVFSALGADSFQSGSHFMPIILHTVFLLFGLTIAVVIHNFSYKYTLLLTYPVVLAAMVLLVMTLVSGDSVNDAARWLSIFGIRFQPSELAKCAMLLYSAWKLDWGRRSPENMKKAFWEILVVAAIFVGLIVKQNLSTALIICVFTYFMLLIGGVPGRYMWRLTFVALAAVAIMFILLYTIPSVEAIPRWSTWHQRLTTEKVDVRDPEYTITDDNMQQHYAKIAIAEGIGVGVFPGNSTQRDFLPEAYNDFIYAIIIEDMGWFGAILLPLLYIILLVRCAKISAKCVRAAPMLLMLGAAFLIVFQAFINMGVSVGLLPVTGQPMPLVSKGGSSQLITCIYFGIILSVCRFGGEPDDQVVLDSEEQEDELYREQHYGTDSEKAG